jgi:hypothetical protein
VKGEGVVEVEEDRELLVLAEPARVDEAVELRLSSLAGCMEAVWRC